MKKIVVFSLLLCSVFALAQEKISGKVINKKNQPVQNVNVYLEGTYDGATTNENGFFSFETSETGSVTLVLKHIDYDLLSEIIDTATFKEKTFVLQNKENEIEAVVISAGTLKAGDNSKIATLKPLDIVTTAGAAGDIIGALETMPGVNAVGESGRLFVRGGEANETQTYVDGIRVGQAYGASIANVPTRSRFSPFLFKGITFSTGGYSAEYGDALSSVLLLNTIDEPQQTQTDISIMTVGLGIGHTKKGKKDAFTINTSYINLAPYNALVPQNITWTKAPTSLGGEAVYRHKTKNGLLKWYVALDNAQMKIERFDINTNTNVDFSLNNTNFYTNITSKEDIASGLQLISGISYANNVNDLQFGSNELVNKEQNLHAKVKLRQNFGKKFKLMAGAEYFYTKFEENFNNTFVNDFQSGFQNQHFALFSEAEYYFSSKTAIVAGVRSFKQNVLDQSMQVEPRISVAHKLSKNGQLSAAYGTFHQLPSTEFLKYKTTIDFENTEHFIVNYLYNKSNQIFRAEAYYKIYNDLIKFDTNIAAFDSNFNNNGNGFARGIDLFWRDGKSIKNLDYWLTYSYIDTQRDYRNFPTTATPSFVAKHNGSVVTKYWVSKLKSQIGLTFTFNSGRPFNDPNSSKFMSEKTQPITNLSLGWSYLLTQQKIIYFSASNLLGANNIFGYEYANSPDSYGVFQRQAITQPADRFFFIGFFWTISGNKKVNQLDNL